METTTDLGRFLVAFVSLGIAITSVFVALRCYVRIALQKSFVADDYLLVFSQGCFLVVCSMIFFAMDHGLGKHVMDVILHNPYHLVIIMKGWWVMLTFYGCAVTGVKICIALFFCTLTPPRKLYLAATCMIWMSIATFLGWEILIFCQCRPLSFYWDRFHFGAVGFCMDRHKSVIILHVLNSLLIITDVILATLPCIMVQNMNLKRKEKISVAILLSLGILTAITAFIRAFYLQSVFDHIGDMTYSGCSVAIFLLVEPGTAIFVVCAVRLRPLAKQLFPKAWFSISEPSVSDIENQRQQRSCLPDPYAAMTLDERLKMVQFYAESHAI